MEALNPLVKATLVMIGIVFFFYPYVALGRIWLYSRRQVEIGKGQGRILKQQNELLKEIHRALEMRAEAGTRS